MQPAPVPVEHLVSREYHYTAEKIGFICSNFHLYNMPSGLEDNEDDTDYEEVLSGFINSHYFLVLRQFCPVWGRLLQSLFQRVWSLLYCTVCIYFCL